MQSGYLWTGLWAALVMSGTLAAAGKTIHASPSGCDTNDGVSWNTARQTLHGALAMAGNEDTVLVSNGCYRLAREVVITNAVTIKSLNGHDSVVIAGDFPRTTNRCFALKNPNAALDGLTLSNGYAATGGAVHSWGGGYVRNCLILNNTATYRGGGLYFAKNGTVENCRLFQNAASNAGGGIFCAAGTEIRDSSFGQNRSDGEGGGIWLSSATLANCVLMGNRAGNVNGGGGIRTYHGGRLEHCLVYGNFASSANPDVCLHMATNFLCASVPVMKGRDNFSALEFMARTEKQISGVNPDSLACLERLQDCWQADLDKRFEQVRQDVGRQAEDLDLIRQSRAYAGAAEPLLKLAKALEAAGAKSRASADEIMGALSAFYKIDFSDQVKTLKYKILLDRVLE